MLPLCRAEQVALLTLLQSSPGATPIPFLPPYPFLGGSLSQTIMARLVLLSVSPFLALFLPPPKLAGLQQAMWTVALRVGVAGRAESSPAQPSFLVVDRGYVGRRAAPHC